MDHPTAKSALDYHQHPQPGKLCVTPTKPLRHCEDLALAYSPGVAVPCRAIAQDPNTVYDYTAKQNLVAVISNGTAVLGLGNIGPLAAKPVMEGKAVLFKKFAHVDAFDIELDAPTPADIIATVKAIAPTFGGINLEDIKAPDCFVVEQALREALDIPVMHDDQHGTAIVVAAGLRNALQLAGKKLDQVRIVINGAGAGALACAHLLRDMGANHLKIFDSRGLLHVDRTGLTPYKAAFAVTGPCIDLAEALAGADVFIGLSVANLITPVMLQGMAEQPIIFALANPDPEITYEAATAARSDVIMATGRSDYPNQINNVLGFPFIFRGALDVRATTINAAMQHAAVDALAALAQDATVTPACKVAQFVPSPFGKEALIPSPLDPRLLATLAPAVAQAAVKSGVARQPVTSWLAYTQQLNALG